MALSCRKKRARDIKKQIRGESEKFFYNFEENTCSKEEKTKFLVSEGAKEFGSEIFFTVPGVGYSKDEKKWKSFYMESF